MKTRFLEHILSIIVVTLVLVLGLLWFKAGRDADHEHEMSRYEVFGDIPFLDSQDPFHRALFRDAVNIYYPDQIQHNDSLVQGILDYRRKAFSDKLRSGHLSERLTAGKAGELGTMYLKFLAVYIVVMLLTYYGVQTLAVWRFCKLRHEAEIEAGFGHRVGQWLRSVVLFVASMVLFSPAYVIAYSIRTQLDTDTAFFMTLLGVISNGLLMVYANKFYAFLVAESRKGYVETARVKNLHNTYDREADNGIRYGAMLRLRKRFDGHVFGHIFQNARRQYLPAVKEQASFLITGLIIIEMALNIHGHLSYEMLRQLLYRNYDIVVAIILMIFYTVKATEVFSDVLVYRANKRIEN